MSNIHWQLFRTLSHNTVASEMEALSLLQRHFADRTIQFLAPLNRYFSTLIPTHEASRDSATIGSFDQTKFLLSLKAHGTPLPMKSASRKSEMYKRWLSTPGFGLWLAEKERSVTNALSKPTK